jgi:carbonic anhydrase
MAAQAASWEKIVGDNGRMVEIDASGIFDSDRGTKVSWGRVVLSAAEAAKAGYSTIKALNRYDCLNRSFSTIKRVYLDDENNVMREEIVPDQTPLLVRRNSVDERILRKTCGLAHPDGLVARTDKGGAASARLGKVAAAAGQAAKSASAAAKARQTAPPANLETSLKDAPPKAVPIPVASATVASAPEKSVVTKAPAKPALSVPAYFEATPATAPMPPISRQSAAASAAPLARSSAKIPPASAGTGARPEVFPALQPARRASPSRTFAPAASGSEGWSYFGAGGPEFWGRLRPEWRLCGEGARQSPIDFSVSAPVAVDLEPVRFDYRPSRFRITDSGRQLRVEVGEGMGMEVRGRRYALEGFVLRRPGETRIAGRAADMEAQFFHRDGEGGVAVLAVQVTRGDASNALLQALLNNLPLEKGGSYMPELMIDLAGFLPANPAHFLYMGSLTAPPCTEGVLWVVMKEPVTLSDEQFSIFVRLHPGNARPPQPASGRLVLESR